jgi:hypothetical protein
MGDEREPDRTPRREDEKVQEEIRRLFARYRELGRRTAVTPDRSRPRADGG